MSKFISYNTFLNEKYVEDSVWRSTSQEWLLAFFKNNMFIDHKEKFISFSFDSESGGQDNFGGKEIVIEFDKSIILEQAKKQGYGKVYYDEDYFEEHPDVCLYITGYKSKQDYYEDNDVLDDEEAYEKTDMLTWEMNIETYMHEQEIVMKKLEYKENLIKNIVFHVPANKQLLNIIKRKNISTKLKKGVDDTQLSINF